METHNEKERNAGGLFPLLPLSTLVTTITAKTRAETTSKGENLERATLALKQATVTRTELVLMITMIMSMTIYQHYWLAIPTPIKYIPINPRTHSNQMSW